MNPIQSMCKWLDSNKEVIGVVVGIGGLIFGLYQYYSAQTWKKTEFASKQVELLSSDPMISLASRALEWRARDFRIPDNMDVKFSGTFFSHEPSELKSALIPHDEKKEFTDNEIFYLDIYDHYFNYLERINHYINRDLFSLEDIEPICYRATLLTKANGIEYTAIHQYLHYYDFTDVVELIDQCKEAFPSHHKDTNQKKLR